MSGRAINEEHRASTPLELLFDLIFVIAIASASSSFHHALADHHILEGLQSYGMVFFAIWWAWMNFTWYASAYDTDDTWYRLTTFLLMVGALVFAVGVDNLFGPVVDPTVIIIGYVIMRIAMVIHWLRAAAVDEEYRSTCIRYAGGIMFAQVLWIIWIFIPSHLSLWYFLFCMLIELYVPIYAEGKQLSTSWHPHHIAERYGLLTIIVLGEGLLGTANTLSVLLENQVDGRTTVLPLGLGAAGIVFGLWWVYFELPWGKILETRRNRVVSFIFGYGHFFIFAALAAVGTGFELIADVAQSTFVSSQDHTEHAVSPRFALLVLSISMGLYLVVVSLLKMLLIRMSTHSIFDLLTAVVVSMVPMLAYGLGMNIVWSCVSAVLGILVYYLVCTKEKVIS